MKSFPVLPLVAALAAFNAPARADLHVWTGAGANKLWSNPANWQAPAGAPQPGESGILLAFPAGLPAAALRSTNNIANLVVDAFTINGNNFLLAGTGAGTSITVRQGILGTGSGNQFDTTLSMVVSNTLIFNLNAGADLTIQSAISGPGGLWQAGDGSVVTLSGLNANTYGGTTRVDGGTLQLQNGFILGTVAVPGPLIIGNTNGSYGTVRLLGWDQIADGAPVSVIGDSHLDLNGNSDMIGSLDMIGGTVTTGSGLLTLNGGVTYRHSSVINGTISGRLNLGAVSRVFDVVTGRLDVSARIQGTGAAGIIKEGGGGVLGLWGTNTFAGPTTIQEGQVNLYNDQALGVAGAGAAGTSVHPGAELALTDGVQVTGETLQLDSHGLFGVTGGLYGAGTVAWNGNVILEGDSSIQVAGGFFTINGVVSGGHSLAKTGAGTLRFSGATDNTFTGPLQVNQGLMQFAKSAGVDALRGPLVIGNNIGGVDADIVRLLNGSQIPDDLPITINASGLLDLNASVDVLGPITFNGGHLDSGHPAVSAWLGGDITVNANTNARAVIDGAIFFYGNTNRTFDLVGHYHSPDLAVNASVGGQATAALVKRGSGEMALSHTNNTYQGLTLVQQGSLQLSRGSEPGSTANGTVVSNGAAFGLLHGTQVGNEALTLHGTAARPYCFFSGFGSNSWAGPVTLAGDAVVSVFFTNDFLNLAGRISGPGALELSSPGTLILSGNASNSFTGGTFVHAGRLVLAHTGDQIAIPGPLTIGDGQGGPDADVVQLVNGFNQIHGQARLIVNSSGLLDVGAAAELFGSLEGTGNIRFNTGLIGTGFNGLTTTFAGRLIGDGGFNVNGPGRLTLATGSPAFVGNLVAANGGTLIVDGSYASADASVFTGSLLGGSGQVQSIAAFTNGVVAPGSSPGQLKVTQGVGLRPGSIYRVELNGVAAGASYDQIAMNGALGLTNAVLQVTTGFNSKPGNVYTIINNNAAGAVNGTFLNLPQNAILSVDDAKFRISYTGASGNDVTLTHLNSNPRLSSVNLPPHAPEGSAVTLTGIMDDPDAGDTLRVIVAWGDGSITTNVYAGTVTNFAIPHTYADDNPSGTPQDTYPVSVRVEDAQGAISSMLQDSIIVDNVTPVVSLASEAGIAGGQPLQLTGSFTDPGSDTWTGLVNYGDGSGAQALSLSPGKTFALNHTFPSNGVYQVTVSVGDDDTGTGITHLKAVVGLELDVARSVSRGRVDLSWSAVFPTAVLQRSPAVTGAAWTAVTNVPVPVGNQLKVTLPATNAAAFFRLQLP